MLTCDQIKEAVRKYNDENSGLDLALKEALDTIGSVPPTSGRFLTEVCLVADWGTIPSQTFPFDDRVAMAEKLQSLWPQLKQMRNSQTMPPDDETKVLTSAIDALSRALPLPTPGVRNRQLSFLSKYLHWCVNCALPIWDGNARRALHNDEDEPCWNSYQGWVNSIRQEIATHKDCLEEVRSPDECLTRTLDKALYMIGRR